MRNKIKLIFVLGTLNAFQEFPDWYLKIDYANSSLVEMLQMEAFSRILWRGCGHIEKLGILTDIYFRANQQNAVAIINGKRNGYFVQRTGGWCTKLAKEIETVEIEIDPPKVVDNPVVALIGVWPSIPETSEDLLKGASFTQWPGGTHYYVRLKNGMDVEIDDKSKWDTYNEAREATIKFIVGLKKT